MRKLLRLGSAGLMLCGVLWSAALAQAQSAGTRSPTPAVAPTIAVKLTVASPAPLTVTPPQVAAASTPISSASLSPTPAPPNSGLHQAALMAPLNHADDTTLGQRAYDQTLDGSREDPYNWALHIFKAHHRIEVYFKNQLFRTYHAVFGRSRWAGGKQWEGDSRTPEGAYLIVAKRRSARFDWFLRLNYPNAADQERFAQLRAEHEISAHARLGGLIGIHGTDSPILNVTDTNWTLGCISVRNADIAEMERLLPVGTLVVINP